jgi:hypothetical protein
MGVGVGVGVGVGEGMEKWAWVRALALRKMGGFALAQRKLECAQEAVGKKLDVLRRRLEKNWMCSGGGWKNLDVLRRRLEKNECAQEAVKKIGCAQEAVGKK